MSKLGVYEAKVLARLVRWTNDMGMASVLAQLAGVTPRLAELTDDSVATHTLLSMPTGYTVRDVVQTANQRLLQGQTTYKLLNPFTETRDIAQEGFEEAIDRLVYRAWELELEAHRR